MNSFRDFWGEDLWNLEDFVEAPSGFYDVYISYCIGFDFYTEFLEQNLGSASYINVFELMRHWANQRDSFY